MSAIVFISVYAAAGFAVTLLCFFLSELIGAVILPSRRRGEARVHRRNRGSGTLNWIGWIIAIAVSLNFGNVGIALLPSWVYYFGIFLMLAGIAERQWAIAVLGRFFSNTLGVQSGQKVVETGPYRLIRHPSYTGVLMILAGIGLVVQSWAAVLIDIIIFGVAYGYRMSVEEKILVGELGESYVDYMKRTKRIIPFLL
jgi:protein-S-isoprenylcysteine O-methyltransferase Ste14